MILRPATIDDARTLFAWRNDPLTRQTSIDTGEVPWEGHLRWLEASLSDPRRTILIAHCDGMAVGTVRIDRGDATELSWSVAPEQRGKGFGKRMVAQAMPRGPVIARIKQDNIASRRIAEGAGFTLLEDGAVQIWIRE